jgi:hypothetical protein
MTSRIEVEPGERQEVMIDISQPYGLARAGRYFVAARAQVNGRRYESNRLAFDVVPGIELASTTRSLPGYADLVRHYSLRYWDRDQREYLFLRVDGERGENYGLFELGPLIRVFPPGIDVDKFGNVKVVHQSGGNRFTHSTFISSRDGVRFVDQVFRRADGRDYRAGAEPEPADKTGKPDAEKPSKGSKTSDGGAKGGK